MNGMSESSSCPLPVTTSVVRSQLDFFAATTPNDTPDSVILFLDEIHRFNKAQQDFLLPYGAKLH